MLPTLRPGDQILVDLAAYLRAPPRQGDIVVARHPYQSVLVIKRVGRVEGHRLELLGDNPVESTDSRVYGLVSVKRILGRVTSRL